MEVIGVRQYIARRENDKCKSTWEFTPESAMHYFGADNDKLIIQESSGQIHALDINTGKIFWSRTIDEFNLLTPEEKQRSLTADAKDYPHILGDVIVLGSKAGYLIAVNLQNGELLWKHNLVGGSAFPAVTEDGKVYKFADFYAGTSVTVIDAYTGDVIKQLDVKKQAEDLGIYDLLSSQSYCDVTDTHFWGTTLKGLLFAVNLETGNIDFHHVLGDTIPIGDPFVICNNRLYMATMNHLITFEGEGGYMPD